MTDSQKVTRRTVLRMTAATAGAVMASSCGAESKRSDTVTSKNTDFYGADGSFDPVKAKQAYLSMMKRFNYPISDVLKGDDLWVCDFLQAEYTKLGMAGIFWTNAKGVYGENGVAAYKGGFKEASYGYLGHEIYLLPGQMLPEHRHIGGAEGYGPKMEAWHVRYGDVHFFGEHKGAGDETLISDMPAAEQPWGFGEEWFKSKYVAHRTASSGKLYSLEDPETWHFQRAGANGAIVSEYATYHNHVEFSKPGMEFDNTKAKEA